MSALSRRALISGGTGFVGSHLIRSLLAEGWDTRVLVRPSSDLTVLPVEEPALVVHALPPSDAEVVGLVRAINPDVVIHLAAVAADGEFARDMVEANVLLGTLLLEGVRGLSSRRLLNTGTQWQHYNGRAFSPVNLYAATKQAFCDILTYYVEADEVAALTLELADTYGPQDRRRRIFHLFRDAIARAEPVLLTPGMQEIDLVYIDDVVAAFRRAIDLLFEQPGGEHRVFAVTSGAPRPLREVAFTYERVTGHEIPAVWGGRPYRRREMMQPPSYTPPLPGWAPEVSLEDGIATMECRR